MRREFFSLATDGHILKGILTRKLAIFAIFLGGAITSAAQEQAYWIRYYNQLTISPKWIWHNEFDERRLINPDRQSQFFFHTHIHHLLNKNFDVAIGLNRAWTQSSANETIPEWRPWQEINFNPTIASRLKYNFRYRLDERFIHNASAGLLEDGYHFVLRHRIRAQALYRGEKEEITLKVFNELMLNTTSGVDTYDQNRIYAAVEVQLIKSVSIEVGYLNQHVNRNGVNTTFNVLRTTIYHRLQLN